ncbi:hypothetical protein GCM10023339_20020 [Alloalcanivorax gelatiniphagus]
MGHHMSTVTPSRRTVVRTAAWTVPVVAASTAVPAYAASPCDDAYTWRLDWGNDQTGDAFTTSYPAQPTTSGNARAATATITGPSGTLPMTVGFTSTMPGADTRTGNNLRVIPNSYTNVGGTGGTGLLLQHQGITSGRANSRQEVVVTFGRAVSDLRFTITDIDSSNPSGSSSDFYDQVELTGNRTGTPTRGGSGSWWNPYFDHVEGDGTPTDPWRMRDQNTVADDNGDNTGNIAVHYPGSVSGFTLTYYSSRGSGNQAVFLSDFTFSARGC